MSLLFAIAISTGLTKQIGRTRMKLCEAATSLRCFGPEARSENTRDVLSIADSLSLNVTSADADGAHVILR